MTGWFRRLVAGTLVLGAGIGSANGKDHFLTIAGGYSPSGNQISLERNVEYFRRVLAETRPDAPPHDVLFADGENPERDLQFRDIQGEIPPARRIALELFGNRDKLDIAYRNHQLEEIRGPSSPDTVQGRLEELSEELGAGDRLFIYVTAHGGSSSDEKNPHNTKLYCWNRRYFTASQFSQWLDGLSTDVPVIMVMVQCYAGGFAHTIFNESNQDKGLSDHPRCGFFSQVHDRMAAGCTPDVNEADYQEYSSFFWTALAGFDRLGNPVEPIDYDGDGETSFAEAHAYAVVESDTIDIPLRTSDALLQKFSRGGRLEGVAGDVRGEQPRRLPAIDEAPAPETFPQLLSRADAIDRAIVERLLEKLELDPEGSVTQIDQVLEEAKRKLSRAERRRGRANASFKRAQQRAVAEVRRVWPELEEPHAPLLAALMAERADEFVATVEGMESYKEMSRRATQLERANDEMLRAQKDDALVRRLQHTCRRIELAANLAEVAPTEIVQHYTLVMAHENSTLARPAGRLVSHETAAETPDGGGEQD